MLFGFTMYLVDYIVINRLGIGGGPLGSGGVIKIFTDPSKIAALRSKAIDFGYTAPFGFAPPKTYRRPEYFSYSGQFFSNFGILGWFPELKLNPKNTLEFTVWCPELNTVKLSLEGVADNTVLVSKELVIPIEER